MAVTIAGSEQLTSEHKKWPTVHGLMWEELGEIERERANVARGSGMAMTAVGWRKARPSGSGPTAMLRRARAGAKELEGKHTRYQWLSYLYA